MCARVNPGVKRDSGSWELVSRGLAQHTVGDVWSSQVKNHFSMYLILCIAEEDI